MQASLVGEETGSINDPEVDLNLEAGEQHVFWAWVHANRAGTVRISSGLGYQARGLVRLWSSQVALKKQ